MFFLCEAFFCGFFFFFSSEFWFLLPSSSFSDSLILSSLVTLFILYNLINLRNGVVSYYANSPCLSIRFFHCSFCEVGPVLNTYFNFYKFPRKRFLLTKDKNRFKWWCVTCNNSKFLIFFKL